MKRFLYFLGFTTLIVTSSCGSQKNNDETTLTPQKTTIKGELKDYYEVVDKEYTITDDTFGKLITVQLKRTDTEFPNNYKKGYEPVGMSGRDVKGNYGFGIEVFDADDNKIYGSRADAVGISGCYSYDDLKDLWELEAGEVNRIRWATHDLDKYLGQKLTFKITSYISEDEDETVSTGNTDGIFVEGIIGGSKAAKLYIFNGIGEMSYELDAKKPDGARARRIITVDSWDKTTGNLKFTAYDYKSKKVVSYFDGIVSNDNGVTTYKGNFTNIKGVSMGVDMHGTSITEAIDTYSNIDISGIEIPNNSFSSSYDSDYSDYTVSSNSSGNADWDEIITEYEKLTDNYVTFINKLERSNSFDVTASIKMSEEAIKIQELTEKIDRAKSNSELTIDQEKRLLKCAEKMAAIAPKTLKIQQKMMDEVNSGTISIPSISF